MPSFSVPNTAAVIPLYGSTESDFDITATYEDSDRRPFDLTGATGKMVVRTSPSGIIFTTLTAANGRFLFPDPANGVFRLRIEAAEMARIPPGVCVYSTLIIFPNGAVVSVMGGNFTVTRGAGGNLGATQTFSLIDGNGNVL